MASEAFRGELWTLGIESISRDPGFHERRAEREVQTLKRMASRIEAGLLWKLGRVQGGGHLMLEHCAHARAHLPKTESSGVAPYTATTGEVRRWRGLSTIEFGAVVLAKRTLGEQRLAKRSGEVFPIGGEPGIILGFADYGGTGRKFYNFRTRRIVVRRDFRRVSASSAAQSLPKALLKNPESPEFSRAYRLAVERDVQDDHRWGAELLRALRKKTHDFNHAHNMEQTDPDDEHERDDETLSLSASDVETVPEVVEPDNTEATVKSVESLCVGDDVLVRYLGGEAEFPGRVAAVRGDRMDVVLLVGTEANDVPLEWVRSVEPISSKRYTARERSGRLVRNLLWRLLGSTEGEANQEWTRQMEALREISQQGHDDQNEKDHYVNVSQAGIHLAQQTANTLKSHDSKSESGDLVVGSTPSSDHKHCDSCLVSLRSQNAVKWTNGCQADISSSLVSHPFQDVLERAPEWVEPGGCSNSGHEEFPCRVDFVIIPDEDKLHYLYRSEEGEVSEVDELECHRRLTGCEARAMISINQRSAAKAVQPDAARCQEARDAIDVELNQFIKNGVLSSPVEWSDIPPEDRRTMLRCFQFVVDKYDAQMNFIKCKARMVVDGSVQDPVTYDVTASPTITMASCKFLLQLAAHDGSKVASTDIVGAFTLSPMKHRVFLEIPPGPYRSKFGRYTRVQKCLYGMKQAAREFYLTMHECLTAAGFDRCLVDPALYAKVSDGEVVMKVGVHVDDTLMIYDDDEALQNLVKHMENFYGTENVKVDLRPDTFLGIGLIYSDDGAIGLCQSGYIEKMTNTYTTVLGDREEKYPHDRNGFKVLVDGKKGEVLSDHMVTKYNELIGSLGYAAVTRFDIQAELSYCRSRLKNPNYGDWCRGLRILRYLRSTKDNVLWYAGPPVNESLEEKRMRNILWCTSDASWNGHVDGRGQSGYTISFGCFQPPFITYAGKQSSIALSSADAEYLVYGELVAELDWFTQVISFLKVSLTDVHIETDSMSAFKLSNMAFVGKGVRHNNPKCHRFRDAVLSGRVKMFYRETFNLWADILTKPVMGDQFVKLREWIRCGILPGLRPLLPEQPLDLEKVQNLVDEDE